MRPAPHPATAPVPSGSVVNGSLPAGIGLAVIAGLADDVHISVHGRRCQHPDELASPGLSLVEIRSPGKLLMITKQ